MVRKWSYIINKLIYKNFLISNTSPLLNLKYRFVFKIFKKTTRFKNFNTSYYSNFIRKVVMVNNRRTGWNTYSYVSILWVKNFLQYKKLVIFLQSKLLYRYNTSYSLLNILPTSKLILALDLIKYPINFTIPKPYIQYFVTKLNTLNQLNRKTLPKSKGNLLLLPTTYFNSLSTLHKLRNLGFNFKSYSYSGDKYTLNSFSVVDPVFFNKILLQIIISNTVNLKSIQTLLTLNNLIIK
jgi:hypothetical protein